MYETFENKKKKRWTLQYIFQTTVNNLSSNTINKPHNIKIKIVRHDIVGSSHLIENWQYNKMWRST